MERPVIMVNTDEMHVFCRNQCANVKCTKHISKAYECGGAARMCRVHITEETQMKENMCVDCKYYERCGKPERYMKCMGYEERQQAAEETETDVHD